MSIQVGAGLERREEEEEEEAESGRAASTPLEWWRAAIGSSLFFYRSPASGDEGEGFSSGARRPWANWSEWP